MTGNGKDRAQSTFFYRGSSMTPLLREGDVLEVVPYDGATVRRWDVIVYDSPWHDLTVVHRVVRVEPEGIRTRGDANSRMDPYVLAPADIKGRVTLVRRAQGQFSLYPGAYGLAQGWLVKLRQHAYSLLLYFLEPGSRMLMRATRLRRYALMALRPQLLCFNRACGTEIQLSLGGRVIAKRLPDSAHWQIRHRYRLLVDEKLLLDWLR